MSTATLPLQAASLSAKIIEQIALPVSGGCYEAAYARVSKAAADLPCPTPFPAQAGAFWRIWRSANGMDAGWTNLPAKYRAAGPPGAMEKEGWGTMVPAPRIWAGDLQPGAVVQIWPTKAIHDKVQRGETLDKDREYGHAFIFRSYVRDATGAITGMRIADQGGTSWSNKDVLKSEWEIWMAANVRCK